jgi:hypothetical protein
MNTQTEKGRNRPATAPGKTVAFQKPTASASADLEAKTESLGASQALIQCVSV